MAKAMIFLHILCSSIILVAINVAEGQQNDNVCTKLWQIFVSIILFYLTFRSWSLKIMQNIWILFNHFIRTIKIKLKTIIINEFLVKFCNPTKPDKLNVHIISHTHLDAGWVKTYDEYYHYSEYDILQKYHSS